MLTLYIIGAVFLYIAIGLVLVHAQIRKGWVSDAKDFWSLAFLWFPVVIVNIIILVGSTLLKAPKKFADWYINKFSK